MWLLVTLSGLALATAVLLVHSHGDGMLPWVAFLIIPIFTGLAFAGWLHSATGILQWDGQHWLWSGFLDAPVRHTTLIVDFQRLMLVKITSESGRVAWLWLEGHMDDARWLAVRRAVIASQAAYSRPDKVVSEPGNTVA
ncbi:MAG: hypothetical protein KGN32_09790 [Burkholderiales bacterium]|nr:hypothetical protein [Burkholderiales bacterium]